MGPKFSSKANKQRMLAAALLVPLAIPLVWWHWPRGDSRFVGKWTYVETNGARESAYGSIQLNRNGSAQARFTFSSSFDPVSWRVDGDALRLNETFANSPQWVHSLNKWCTKRVSAKPRMFGYKLGYLEFKVLRVEGGRMILKPLGSAPETKATVTRSSE